MTQSARATAVAYVDLDEVVKHDPLYPQLSNIDQAIAMVELVGASPRIPRNPTEIARQSAALKAEMQAAQTRTAQIVAQKREDYQRRARAAVTSALAAAGVKNASDVAQAMGMASAQQMQQAQIAAGRDLMSYRQSVIQQSNTAASGIVRQLQREAAQKLSAKLQQQQQVESNLSLHLSQQNAQRRLSIETRLSMLALSESERKDLQSQLAAMQSQESSAMAAQRQADQRAYAAYRKEVMTQTNAAIRAQLGHIQNTTQAELAGRRNAVVAQLRQLSPTAPPLSPATRAQIEQIASRFQQQYQQDVQNVVDQYEQTQAALEAQYDQLRGAGAAATAASNQEIALLQERRATLYDQIAAHVRTRAQRLAQQKGFSLVFSDVTAAVGAHDMTNELITDIESEHE
jgi:hypothetical protein